MSTLASRCQGCGASLSPAEAAQPCPYCGRVNASPGSETSWSSPSTLPGASASDAAAQEVANPSVKGVVESSIHYFNRALGKYATFSGRASRAEYWYFFLAVLVLNLGLAVLSLIFSDSFLGDLLDGLSTVFLVLMLIPSLSIGVRRLHDINKSGWWYLVVFVPLIGPLLLLYWAIQPGDTDSNMHGPQSV